MVKNGFMNRTVSKITMVIASMLVSAMCIFALAGCGTTPAANDDSSNAASSADVSENKEPKLNVNALKGTWVFSDIAVDDADADVISGDFDTDKELIIPFLRDTYITFDIDNYKMTLTSMGETSTGTFVYDDDSITFITMDKNAENVVLGAVITIEDGKLIMHGNTEYPVDIVFTKLPLGETEHAYDQAAAEAEVADLIMTRAQDAEAAEQAAAEAADAEQGGNNVSVEETE